MPTNANTFNSRITSEALESKFRSVFPSQSGAELPQDLFASGVIQPVVDFSSIAEGSVLQTQLQTAWDFSTGSSTRIGAGNDTIITTPGFWKVDLNVYLRNASTNCTVSITDGFSSKNIWKASVSTAINDGDFLVDGHFVVFVRAGDSVIASQTGGDTARDIWYRQIADVYGTLVNPLGYTSS